MAESAYVFQRVDDQRELERLRMIELVFDPASRRRLLATGLQSGWRCLEVGPGAGSIMTSQVVEKARRHRSHIRSETQRTRRSTISPLRSLRPCWTGFLNNLRALLEPCMTSFNPMVLRARMVFQHSVGPEVTRLAATVQTARYRRGERGSALCGRVRHGHGDEDVG